MIVVYIAGPFRAPTEYRRRHNIARAESFALALWRKNIVAICPHLNTAHFDGEADDSVWLRGDLELLRRSDAVFLVPGWERAEGATAERMEATMRQLPVFEDLDVLFDWASAYARNRRPLLTGTQTEVQ